MAVTAVRSLPWARIFLIARTVLERVGEDIPKKDRQRLGRLLKKSKGDPRNLTPAERHDIVVILRRVDVTKLGKDLALLRGLKMLRK